MNYKLKFGTNNKGSYHIILLCTTKKFRSKNKFSLYQKKCLCTLLCFINYFFFIYHCQISKNNAIRKNALSHYTFADIIY